ncbi:MAG: DNA polymerase I [Ruminococcaceae bacterium]|nr:DNA polymerase I [Oscillospiraceae bacterium]
MKLLVLDGNSIVNRAFYGIKLLSTKNGQFTNGIYGFLNILNRIESELTPDAVAVAFDLKAPTFRHKTYDGYKAQRKGMPQELASQMQPLKDILTALGYKIVTCEGFEADDILGTLAKNAENNGDVCFIATGDRDSLQLVSPHTSVRLASTKFGQSTVTVYDEAKIMEDYGVTPKQLIDIKSIQGDTSDNIPGAKGIGEKGAKELIQKFGGIDYIYEHIDEIDIKPLMRQKLIDSMENVKLSYYLGTINTEAPIEKNASFYVKNDVNKEKASSLMAELELFTLMEKFGLNVSDAASEEEKAEEIKKEITKVCVKECASLLPMLEDEGNGKAYFLSEYKENGEISKMSFFIRGEKEDNIYILNEPSDAFVKAFAKSRDIKKYTHDIKPFHKAVKKLNAEITGEIFDTSLAAYLLNPSATVYSPDKLAAEYKLSFKDEESVVCVLPELISKIKAEVKENNQEMLLYEVEIPLSKVLAEMECEGFRVDREGISEYGKELKVQIDALSASIMQQVGYEFNINSPKQLGEALFEKMGLPHGKKTKSGYSTSAEVLESLRYESPVVEDILNYRALSKLYSTYCEGLVKEIKEDGRIHSSFNQTETRTGRISSTEPNLQNIPVRTELGRELRKYFIAKEGYTLIDADYSQIELRVLAHVAKDEVMRDAFINNKDIHRATAARVFGLPEEIINSQMRSRAKAVNFGIVYGIGAFSLSKDIGVSRKEADDYIKEYLRNFSGVRDYMENIINEAKEKGYTEDIFGRRRYLPELKSSNFNMRAFGERVARNMPIQGAAADIIKIAMVKVSERLKKEKLEAKLILQVHDELIVEAPFKEAEKVKEILEYEMENAVSLSVPMKAEANVGENWYLAKG